MNGIGSFLKVKQNWTEDIEIDENTVEEGKILEETTELVTETIELVAQFSSNCCTRFDNKGGEKSTSTCMVSRL